jgi:uncharacterized membrane protein YfcA
MDVLLLLILGAGTGTLSAMLGIGGGVLLVPALVLGFGIPFEHAVPASLTCVVASSCGAAASHLEHQLSDVRLAMTLELATVVGAILGGLLAGLLPSAMVALLFGAFTLYVATQLFGAPLRSEQLDEYTPSNYPVGIAGSFLAGGFSAVLGVGGGPIKVPLMNLAMGVPLKVASATSNLMIGVTAAASVAAYGLRGQLDLPLAAPLVVGVLMGSLVGSRLLVKMKSEVLRRIFAVVMLVVAGQMLWKGGLALWEIR